jgi:hypothetical protein
MYELMPSKIAKVHQLHSGQSKTACGDGLKIASFLDEEEWRSPSWIIDILLTLQYLRPFFNGAIVLLDLQRGFG